MPFLWIQGNKAVIAWSLPIKHICLRSRPSLLYDVMPVGREACPEAIYHCCVTCQRGFVSLCPLQPRQCQVTRGPDPDCLTIRPRLQSRIIAIILSNCSIDGDTDSFTAENAASPLPNCQHQLGRKIVSRIILMFIVFSPE